MVENRERMARDELIAAARSVHVPGNVEVDVLCRHLADELERATNKPGSSACRHPHGHPLTGNERAWYSAYSAHASGYVDSARAATRQVFGEGALA